MKLNNCSDITSGISQFRITLTEKEDSSEYVLFNQSHLENDLYGTTKEFVEDNTLRTNDEVSTVKEGDIIFSLISGTASIVSKLHQNYLLTQNYALIKPDKRLNPKYLVYILNEHPKIKLQLYRSLQGSKVIRYTFAQLRELELPPLPDLDEQSIVGELYFDILKLYTLRNSVASLEKQIVLFNIKEHTK